MPRIGIAAVTELGCRNATQGSPSEAPREPVQARVALGWQINRVVLVDIFAQEFE